MQRALAIAFLFAACGDNGSRPPDAAPGTDAVSDVYVPKPLAVAVAGDFDTTGIMTKLEVESLTATMNAAPVGAVGGDPVIRKHGDRLFVINRLGASNITIFDANTLAFIDQLGAGTNTNPQDVAVVGSDTLYVATLNDVGLVKIDIPSGDVTPIDLGTALSEPDGNPDCVSVYAVGTNVYVACGLLDEDFLPRGPGKVVVVDALTDTITGNATLPYANPQGRFVRAPESTVFTGDLLIATSPSFSNYETGCVARVSTDEPVMAGCAEGLTNAELGGFQTRLDVTPDGTLLWLAVGTLDAAFENPTGSLRGFDLMTGMLWQGSVSSPDYLISDAAGCSDGSVVAIDRTFNAAGMRVWKNLAERTTDALSIGLPPGFGNNIVCYDVPMP